MTVTETYLTSLQGKIFKLLPMREAYDQGVDNHLDEYIGNLCANFMVRLIATLNFPRTARWLKFRAIYGL